MKRFIGEVRYDLFIHGEHEWNGVVRDVTARLETSNEQVDEGQVLKELAVYVRNKELSLSLASNRHAWGPTRYKDKWDLGYAVCERCALSDVYAGRTSVCSGKIGPGYEEPTIENRGLGSGIVETCIRPLPHICAVNGPCNGWPKPGSVCSGCGAAEGTNHNFDCPEAQD